MRPSVPIPALAMSILLAAPAAIAANCPPTDLFHAPDRILLEYGSYPVSVATGDFDADGHLDLAVTELDTDQVTVLFGRGDGTFRAAVKHPAGPLPRGVVAADLDGDGALDLAVSDVGDSVVSVLLGVKLGGLPSGAFAPAVAYPAGAENRGLVAFDWSGDGALDLVVAGRTAIALLRQLTADGHGTGTFERAAVHPTPGSWGVAAGSWGPGAPWYVGANWTSSELTVVGGAAIPMPAGSAEITTGDLDGDGRDDLVVPGQDGIRVLLAHPTLPQFGPPSSIVTDTRLYNDAVVLDVNQDGHADIAATDAGWQDLAIWLGAGDGTFPVVARWEAYSGPNGIAAGDFDEDGRADLVVVNSGTSAAVPALYLYRGRCGFLPVPELTGVQDVPNDEGGKVAVTWTRSILDAPGPHGITGYRLWRRVPAPGAPDGVAEDLAAFRPGVHARAARPAGTSVEYWEPVAELPAAFLDGYGSVTPTTQDSIAGSNPYTAFFVQALTNDPLTFYSSAVDSGYSVDDLAPARPTAFVASTTGAGAALQWAPNPAPDLAHFRVHRGVDAAFAPSGSNLIATPSGPSFVDASGTTERCYKLAAVDVHGNVSAFAETYLDGIGLDVASDGPAGALRVPSPVRAGDVTVEFTFPAGRSTRVELIDVGGRVVAARQVGAPGARTIALAPAGALRPGLYFVRVGLERPRIARVVVMR